MKKRPLIWYFILTFLITWGIAALYFVANTLFDNLFGEMSLTHPIFIVAVWGPNIAAVIVASVLGKGREVKGLLRKFVPVRTNVLWYFLAIVLFPLSGILINLAAGDPILMLELPQKEVTTLLIAILITGPLGEELGWRGFALSRMLEKQSALGAGIVIGLIWGIWHLPSFFMSGLPQMGAQIPLFMMAALALSVFVTWIFVNTRRNVFISFLVHYSVNFTYMLIGSEVLYFSILQIVLAVLIIVIFGKDLKVRRN